MIESLLAILRPPVSPASSCSSRSELSVIAAAGLAGAGDVDLDGVEVGDVFVVELAERYLELELQLRTLGHQLGDLLGRLRLARLEAVAVPGLGLFLRLRAAERRPRLVGGFVDLVLLRAGHLKLSSIDTA